MSKLLKLEQELNQMKRNYEEMDTRYDILATNIEELETEKDCLGEEMNDLEVMIETAEKELQQLRFENLNVFTDDPFTNAFIQASYFADRSINTVRPVLACVHITHDELWALDGFKGIRIKCDDIPVALVGSNIKWDTRVDFINPKYHVEGEYPKLLSLYDDEYKYSMTDLTVDNFREKLKAEDKISSINDEIDLTHLCCDKLHIAFNIKYLTPALEALRGQTFTAYFNTSTSPMRLTSDKMDILVLPVRLIRGY